jgi:hypothetical protein
VRSHADGGLALAARALCLCDAVGNLGNRHRRQEKRDKWR